MNNNLNNLNYYYNEPEINTYINKFNLKNLIELSTISDLYLFKKKKNSWILKDKRILLKECEYKKKKNYKRSINIYKYIK